MKMYERHRLLSSKVEVELIKRETTTRAVSSERAIKHLSAGIRHHAAHGESTEVETRGVNSCWAVKIILLQFIYESLYELRVGIFLTCCLPTVIISCISRVPCNFFSVLCSVRITLVISITSLWINNDYAISICNIFEFRSICFIWVSTLVLSSMQREYYRHIRFSCHRSRYIEPVSTVFAIDIYSACYVIGIFSIFNIVYPHLATVTKVYLYYLIVTFVCGYVKFVMLPVVRYSKWIAIKCLLRPFFTLVVFLKKDLDLTISWASIFFRPELDDVSCSFSWSMTAKTVFHLLVIIINSSGICKLKIFTVASTFACYWPCIIIIASPRTAAWLKRRTITVQQIFNDVKWLSATISPNSIQYS